MNDIHTARSAAQDAIHYAIWLMADRQSKGRESTFVRGHRLTRAFAWERMLATLAAAGITSRTSRPVDVVAAVDAWGDAQGWNAFCGRPAGEI